MAMKKISEIILDRNAWIDFFNYKTVGKHLSAFEEKDLLQYVENKEYLPLALKFINSTPFPFPNVRIINKQNSNKKRIVFLYPREENYFLKFISFHLLSYDYIFNNNLCSFRTTTDVKRTIRRLVNTSDIDKKFVYKVDVSDYFNSVDIDILLPLLKEALEHDENLYLFIAAILTNPYSVKDGKNVLIKKGIMAGVPIASFLANLYLKELDQYFYNNKVIYIRYSDDIIVFADTQEELDGYIETIKNTLAKYKLTINKSKEIYTAPGEAWEFLGFSYKNGKVDVSSIATDKLKKKLKRKASALVRWKEKNNASNERAVRAFIKRFNRKLFDNPIGSETTWARWYFPVINTDKTLHEIDQYMQDCIRFIANGNYSKSRFNFRYEDMKRLGYISLVNRYYRFLNEDFKDNK